MTRGPCPPTPLLEDVAAETAGPGTEYAMSSLICLTSFWRDDMIEKAIAIVSSCIKRLSSTRGGARHNADDRMRADLMSDQSARSAAIFNKSLMCTRSPGLGLFIV